LHDIKNIIKHTSQLKLLFVEDHDATRNSALIFLKEFFDDIVIANDGIDGFNKFKNNDVDLILTDISMPHLGGLEMSQKIREIDENIPIVILSAHMEPQYFMQSIRLNVKGYLAKPVDMNSLLDLLHNIISSILLEIEVAKNQKIKEQDHRYLQTIVDSVQDPVMVIKEDYTVELMNSNLLSQLDNFDIADKETPKCYEISHHRTTPCDGIEYPCPLRDVLETHESTTVVHKHCDPDGQERHMELVATPLFDDSSNCTGIVESARDITAHIQIQEELRKQRNMLHYQAYHDKMTGLANRILFDERLDRAVAQAKENETKIALLFVDLDKFKRINDTLGHKVGDSILNTVANIMHQETREEDTVARIGGDEFTIIINNLTTAQEAKSFAEKLLQAIEEPILYEEHTLHISASIGISIYRDDTSDIEDLLKYADIAMYRAKKSTKNICYYSSADD